MEKVVFMPFKLYLPDKFEMKFEIRKGNAVLICREYFRQIGKKEFRKQAKLLKNYVKELRKSLGHEVVKVRISPKRKTVEAKFTGPTKAILYGALYETALQALDTAEEAEQVLGDIAKLLPKERHRVMTEIDDIIRAAINALSRPSVISGGEGKA